MKKVIIFFPYHHLAYSPTTINLYKCLEPKFHVKIVAPYPSRFNNKELENFNVSYYNDVPTTLFIKVKAFFLLLLKNAWNFLTKGAVIYKYPTLKPLVKYESLFRQYAKTNSKDIVIAVDISFLKIAVKYFEKVHFLSLELTDDLIPVLKTIKEGKIESVIIQSEDRFDYLFPDKKPRVFYLQNSIFFKEDQPLRPKQADTILYNGTATRNFGIFYFLDFLKSFPGRFKGIVKGAILNDVQKEIEKDYGSLISSGQLTLDSTYTSNEDLVEYISAFEIGVCFYDISLFKKDRFNYLTAPSGKMFTYLAGGVPIIASNIPGLKIIKEFKAGVLIDDYSPQSILDAVDMIKKDYEMYSLNCRNAASYFSFEKHAQPLVDYLDNDKRQ